MISSIYRIRSLNDELTTEIEYFQDDGIYQVRILEMQSNHSWATKASMELKDVEIRELVYFLNKTLENQ